MLDCHGFFFVSTSLICCRGICARGEGHVEMIVFSKFFSRPGLFDGVYGNRDGKGQRNGLKGGGHVRWAVMELFRKSFTPRLQAIETVEQGRVKEESVLAFSYRGKEKHNRKGRTSRV